MFTSYKIKSNNKSTLLVSSEEIFLAVLMNELKLNLNRKSIFGTKDSDLSSALSSIVILSLLF